MRRSTAIRNVARVAERLKSCGGILCTPEGNSEAVRISRATVGQLGRLSFPEFCKCFGWRDPKYALVYCNPSAASLSAKL